jgi:hypothetical protein
MSVGGEVRLLRTTALACTCCCGQALWRAALLSCSDTCEMALHSFLILRVRLSHPLASALRTSIPCPCSAYSPTPPPGAPPLPAAAPPPPRPPPLRPPPPRPRRLRRGRCAPPRARHLPERLLVERRGGAPGAALDAGPAHGQRPGVLPVRRIPGRPRLALPAAARAGGRQVRGASRRGAARGVLRARLASARGGSVQRAVRYTCICHLPFPHSH